MQEDIQKINRMLFLEPKRTKPFLRKKVTILRYSLEEFFYLELTKFASRFITKPQNIYKIKNHTYLPNKLKVSNKPRAIVILKQEFTENTSIFLRDIKIPHHANLTIHIGKGTAYLKSYQNKAMNQMLIQNFSYNIPVEELRPKTFLRVKPGTIIAMIEIFLSYNELNLYQSIPYHIPSNKFILFDCEMATLENNQQCLSSICMMDENGKILLNTLVTPINKVQRYITRITGLHDKILRGKIDEPIAIYIAQKIAENNTLIGVGIENDLKVLKLSPLTTRTFDLGKSHLLKSKGNHNYQYYGLKNMAKTFLNIDIQNNKHTALEDTQTILKIFNIFKNDLIDEMNN